MSRPLVLVAHGTRSEHGRADLEEIREAVARAASEVDVRLVLLEHGPPPSEVLAGLTAPVLVPLLLTSGFHVEVDLPDLGATAPGAVITPPLARDPGLVEALADRVALTTPEPIRGVVLVGAGSTRPVALDDIAATAEALGQRLGVPTTWAVLTGSSPTPEDGLAQVAPASNGSTPAGPVVLGALLLTRSLFLDTLATRARELGALSSPAIGAHPGVVDAVLRRYSDAVGVTPPSGPGAA